MVPGAWAVPGTGVATVVRSGSGVATVARSAGACGSRSGPDPPGPCSRGCPCSRDGPCSRGGACRTRDRSTTVVVSTPGRATAVVACTGPSTGPTSGTIDTDRPDRSAPDSPDTGPGP